MAAPVEATMTDAERQRAVTQILLDRIAATPSTIDLPWLAGVCSQVTDSTSLRAYLDQLLSLGARRGSQYEAEQRAAKKAISADPRYFISLARNEIYASRPSARRLQTVCQENLGLGLVRAIEASGGLGEVDEGFMGSFFGELVSSCRLLAELAGQERTDPEPWRMEQMRAVEAALIDRQMRIQHREEQLRRRKEGTQQSAAPELLRTDLLRKSLHAGLLELGTLCLDAAERETTDRTRHQELAERSFAILAMVYQRTHSAEALTAIRRVNEIQQSYLHRMARASWKRAQLAVASGQTDAVSEHYFRATQHYAEAMAKAVGPDKDSIAAEFARLKREIAAWHAQRRAAPGGDGGT